MDQELKDKDTRNWVKACLAVRCLKEGILPFMKKKGEEQYENTVTFLKTFVGVADYTCRDCVLDSLEPYHARKKPCKYEHVKSKCGCHGEGKIRCKEGTCGQLYDLIKDDHVANNPNWSNTKPELWSDKHSGPWERMKCFIFTPGYRETADLSQADITAFVQICANNEHIQRELRDNFKYLDKIRAIRNDLCHSGTMQIETVDFQKHILHMKDVLVLDIFNKYPAARDQLDKIICLENDDARVTVEDEIEAREIILAAIKELKSLIKKQQEDQHETVTFIDKIQHQIADLTSIEVKHNRFINERFQVIESHMTKLQLEHMKAKEKLQKHRLILDSINDAVTFQATAIHRISKTLDEDVKPILKKNEGNCEVSDINSKIVVNPITPRGQEAVSDLLVESANGIGRGLLTILQNLLQTAFRKITQGGGQLTQVTRECMAIYIRFPTLKSWLEFHQNYLKGEIDRYFQPIQEHLRTYLGYEDLELSVDIYEEDFTTNVQSIFYQLDASVEATAEGRHLERPCDNGFNGKHEGLVSEYGGDVIASEEEEVIYENKLLLTGIPINCTEVDVTRFMSETTGYTLVQGSLTFHKRDTSIALATFKEKIDFKKVVERSKSHQLGPDVSFSQVAATHCVYVTALPPKMDTNAIMSYFDFCSEHCVDKVIMQDKSAFVVYLRSKLSVDRILSMKHIIGGKRVDVFRYFPCIEMTELEYIVCAVYDRIHICISRQPREDIDAIEILYPESGNFVCKRDSNSAHICILYNPNMDNHQNHLHRLLNCCRKNYRSIVIKVVGNNARFIDTVVQKVNEWLQHTQIPSLDKICLWSENEEYILAFTSAVQDTNRALGFLPASPNGTENDREFYSTKLLVTSLSKGIKETDLDQFICKHTEYRLRPGSMVFHATKTDIAMITFEDGLDYTRFLAQCGSSTLDGIKPRFSRIAMSHCVIVSHFTKPVDATMVNAYFNGDKLVVETVEMLPGNQRCLVVFSDYNDVNQVLTRQHCIEGCNVFVKRYFTCIARTEPDVFFCARKNELKIVVSRGDWKEMDYDIIEMDENFLPHMVVTQKNSVNVHAAIKFKIGMYDFENLARLADLCGYKSVGIIISDDWNSELSKWWPQVRIDWSRYTTTRILDKLYFCSNNESDLKRIETDLKNDGPIREKAEAKSTRSDPIKEQVEMTSTRSDVHPVETVKRLGKNHPRYYTDAGTDYEDGTWK